MIVSYNTFNTVNSVKVFGMDLIFNTFELGIILHEKIEEIKNLAK